MVAGNPVFGCEIAQGQRAGESVGLGDRIDFEGMVNRATSLIDSGRYQSPFRHILPDEFHDI